MVFKRGPGKGHIGFVVGFSGNSVKVLGGNQRNEVNVKSDTRPILWFGWPEGYDSSEFNDLADSKYHSE